MPLPKTRIPDYYQVIPAANAPELPHGRYQNYVVFLDDNGDPIDLVGGSSASASLQSLQSQYYGEFYKALRNGGKVTIKCRGDSLTYGQDTVSANKRAGIGDTMSNGDVRTTQRAAITYPESLQTAMDEVYGTGKVTVKNEGFSGDNVDLNYLHFATNSKTTNVPCMTLIMLGINDAVGTWNTWYDRIDLFIAGYEKIITRELNWGCGVIMLTPPKVRDQSTVIDGFANALSALAAKYGIPLVDAEEFLANHGVDYFSDGWHMNGKGYEIFGKKVAAMFIGEGGPAKPFVVTNGSRVLTRPTLDNVFYKGAVFGSNQYSYTPAEKVADQGIQAQMTTNGAVIYYSFYTETDDTVIYPVGYLGCDSVQAGNLSKLDFTLDFGVQQPDYSMDDITGITSNYFTTKPPSTVPIALLAGETFFQFGLTKATVAANRHGSIHIARKGWHVLAVKFDKINTTSYGGLMGFEAVNYRLSQLIVPFVKDGLQQASYGTARPTTPAAGYCHYDATLNKPIWWTGSQWKDATGTVVT
ncbi:SGNH/GDSL hydrolase family protein [Paenibacillus zanthoxyli]|uniref:SGNH/GDSL hydrolase family protein n=1 Tax=Paenibacillus zanthoxyli TaxID=369399 RepID=UPI00046F7482|nr:SGNH/GDSL hydrolase family protein [Paenibacillus zanthoxyli]